METGCIGKLWRGRKGLEFLQSKKRVWGLGYVKLIERDGKPLEKGCFSSRTSFEMGNGIRVKFRKDMCC